MELFNDPFIVDAWFLIVLALVPLVLGLLIGWAIGRKRSSPFDESVHPEAYANRTEARTAHADHTHHDRQFESREPASPADQLDIRELSSHEQQKYAESWSTIRSRFVDDPPGATKAADRLIIDVLRTRNYPVDDPERLDAVINVFHPSVIESYRSIHSARPRIERDDVDTEELRRTFVHYGPLFSELAGVRGEEVAMRESVVDRNGSVDRVSNDRANRIRS